MDKSRRNFLKILAAASASSVVGTPEGASAHEDFPGWPDRYGILVDVSRCIGCRSCEAACNEVNKLPKPDVPFDDQGVFEKARRPSAGAFTVVNRHKGKSGKPVFAKIQCMHCNEPACFSACLVKAFTKTKEGAVIYNPDVCIGCRYCIQACPFYMPAYEYDSAFSPRVRKCTMCYDRIKAGGIPACVEACPTEALVFGKREDLIKIARKRIMSDSKYIDHIYGEHEVGGTSWLYISKEPFEQLGFNTNLGVTPIPKYSYGFLWSVPLVLTIWPAFLAGIYSITKRREEVAKEEAEKAREEVLEASVSLLTKPVGEPPEESEREVIQ